MDTETYFISGIDPTISEQDINEFLSKEIQSEYTLNIHVFSYLKHAFLLGELKLQHNPGLTFYQTFSSFKLKNLTLRLIPKVSMKSIIVTNLPTVTSEKDLFLILLRLTPGLKRIIVPEDSENIGQTFGMLIAHYISHDHAAHALESLKKNNNIFQKKVSACWKEPYMDFLSDLSKETRVIYIKNIAFTLSLEELHKILQPYGPIKRITKYATKAYVEFENILNAQKAMSELNEKLIQGTYWRVYAAKVFDKEKFKEKNEKNLSFSKNFLEEVEQEKILKFIHNGVNSEETTTYQFKAKNILENIKQGLLNQIDELKKQANSLKTEGVEKGLSPEVKKKVHIEEKGERSSDLKILE